MYPVTMQTISAERGREMRQQAAAWRRAREARSAARARPDPDPVRAHRAAHAERTVLGRAQAAAGPGSRLRTGEGASGVRPAIRLRGSGDSLR